MCVRSRKNYVYSSTVGRCSSGKQQTIVNNSAILPSCFLRFSVVFCTDSFIKNHLLSSMFYTEFTWPIITTTKEKGLVLV